MNNSQAGVAARAMRRADAVGDAAVDVGFDLFVIGRRQRVAVGEDHLDGPENRDGAASGLGGGLPAVVAGPDATRIYTGAFSGEFQQSVARPRPLTHSVITGGVMVRIWAGRAGANTSRKAAVRMIPAYPRSEKNERSVESAEKC